MTKRRELNYAVMLKVVLSLTQYCFSIWFPIFCLRQTHLSSPFSCDLNKVRVEGVDTILLIWLNEKRTIKLSIFMKITAIIPARYGSTRFEGKPLVDILGKPMIQHVYEGVCQSRLIDEVMVATDDERILEAVKNFGGKAMMTSPDHLTGSDRVAEVARKLKSEIIVNVQGDEPLIKGSIIDKAIRPLLTDKTISISTLMTGISEVKDWLNPHVVKVVSDQKNFALYFSRSPIPFPRDLHIDRLETSPFGTKRPLPKRVFKHIGIYVYPRPFLLRFTKMKPTPLEKLEKLEQLRALENGYRIKLTPVQYEPLCVDTPEDLQKVVEYLAQSR